MPFVSTESLYAGLRPLYEEFPERLVLGILDTPEPAHAPTVQDYDEGCARLIEHLVD